jgi:hypothetical protein
MSAASGQAPSRAIVDQGQSSGGCGRRGEHGITPFCPECEAFLELRRTTTGFAHVCPHGHTSISVQPLAPVPAPSMDAVDGRISPEDRPGLVGIELRVWRLFRWGVLQVTAGPTGRSRRWVADKLDVAPATLDDYLNPSGHQVPRCTTFVRLFADVADPATRAAAGRFLGSLLGLELVDSAATRLDVSPLRTQALEATGALGRVASAVERMTSATSDGGAEITSAEAVELAPVVDDLRREAAEMALCVTGLAAKT